MCISPITINNPYYGLGHIGLNKYLHRCKESKIQVPCGNCPQCLANKQAALIQRAQLMHMDHHAFFQTLTYDEDHIPFLIINGYKHKYCMKSDIQNYFKRLRKEDVFGRPFKYMCVAERGSQGHRPHFHIIYFIPKESSDNEFFLINMESRLYMKLFHMWARNVGTNRNPIYDELSKYKVSADGSRTYDFHACVPKGNGFEDIAFYITKYCLKYDDYTNKLRSALYCNLPESEFIRYWKILRPFVLISKYFGSVRPEYGRTNKMLDKSKLLSDNKLHYEHVRKCVSSSVDHFTFSSPISSFRSPLCHYLAKDSVTLDDVKRMPLPDDQPIRYIEKNEYDDVISKHNRIKQRINETL